MELRPIDWAASERGREGVAEEGEEPKKTKKNKKTKNKKAKKQKKENQQSHKLRKLEARTSGVQAAVDLILNIITGRIPDHWQDSQSVTGRLTTRLTTRESVVDYSRRVLTIRVKLFTG